VYRLRFHAGSLAETFGGPARRSRKQYHHTGLTKNGDDTLDESQKKRFALPFGKKKQTGDDMLIESGA
jgi:hypothetical protein